MKAHRGAIGKFALVIAIAAIAYWYFGNGMIYEYFTAGK
jgi:hypothetical protein